MERKFYSKPELKELVGTIQNINPQRLLNKNLLFTTQNWVDMVKLGGVLNSSEDSTNPPCGWVSTTKGGEIVYIVGEGNHRISLACIHGLVIPFCVVDVWNPDSKKSVFGFNCIVKKVREALGME